MRSIKNNGIKKRRARGAIIMRWLSYMTLIVNGLILFTAVPVMAAEITLGGALNVELLSQTLPEFIPAGAMPETLLNSNLDLKLNLNHGEKQSGTVLLQYRVQSPSLVPDQIQDPGSLVVNQAYLDLELSPVSFLRAGRQKISWGSGLVWNPTNYIGTDKNRADLTTANPGVDGIESEFVWGDSLIVLALKSGKTGEDWGRAVKFATRLGGLDLAVSGYRQGGANGYGVDGAITLGDEYTIYGEYAWKTGSNRYDSPLTALNRPVENYYLHGVIGIGRNWENGSMAHLEYYHNQEGLSEMEASDYFNYLAGLSDPSERMDMVMNLYGDLRCNYLFLMMKTGSIMDDLILSGNVLYNCDDLSYQITPMLQYRLGQNTTAELTANFWGGEKETEFGSMVSSQVIGKVTVCF